MPTTPYAKLLASVNGATAVAGAFNVAADDDVQIVPESTVGWKTQASIYQITAFPPGWVAPSPWTYDAAKNFFVYVANGTNGTAPPPLTMPSAAEIASGLWGKWKVRLLVNGGGGQLTDWTLAFRLPSNTGVEDVAVYEGPEFGGPMKAIAALQADLRLLDAAIAGGVGGGASLGSGTPASVTAAASVQGVLLTAARFDHTHQVTTGTPVDIGTANAAGAATSMARSNHVHKLPWSTVVSVFGAASSDLDMNARKLTGLADPTSGSQDAATAAWVENYVQAWAGNFPSASDGLLDTAGLWTVQASDGSILVDSSGVKVGVLQNGGQHGNLPGGALHAVAVGGVSAGFISGLDQAALDTRTEDPTANAMVVRGTGGRAAFGWIGPTTTAVGAGSLPANGFIRLEAEVTTIIGRRNNADNADQVLVGLVGDGGLRLGAQGGGDIELFAKGALGVYGASNNEQFVISVTGGYARFLNYPLTFGASGAGSAKVNIINAAELLAVNPAANTNATVVVLSWDKTTATFGVGNSASVDTIIIGSDTADVVRVIGADFSVVTEPSDNASLQISDSAIDLGIGTGQALGIDVGATTIGATTFALTAKSFAYVATAAASTVQALDATWQGQAAHSGDSLSGGGFAFTVGAGGGGSFIGGSFKIDLGAASTGNLTGLFKLRGASTDFFTAQYDTGASVFTVPTEARWAVGAAGFTVYTGSDLMLEVDPAGTLNLELIGTLLFGSGRSPTPLLPIITQTQMAGTAGANAPDIKVIGATGQNATGGADNSRGGNIKLIPGPGGTGGGGHAGLRGSVYLGYGTAGDGGGENVVVVHNAVVDPGSTTNGFIMYASSGNFRLQQQTPQPYTLTYGGTLTRTMAAYTSDPESSAYTGLDNAQVGSVYAALTDINALRTAYENLRALVENLANVTKALVTDQKTMGLLG